jgi:hypothetical protein
MNKSKKPIQNFFKNNKSFLSFVFILTFIVLLITILFILFKPNTNQSILLKPSEDIDYTKPYVLEFYFDLIQPSDSNGRQFQLLFSEIVVYIPEDRDDDFGSICFEGLTLKSHILYEDSSDEFILADPMLCLYAENSKSFLNIKNYDRLIKHHFVLDDDMRKQFFFVYSPHLVNYPNDSFIAELELYSDIYFEENNFKYYCEDCLKDYSIHINFQEDPSKQYVITKDWQISSYSPQSHGPVDFPNSDIYNIEFSRPAYIKLMVVIPLIVIFIFEFSLLFADTFATFIKGSVGLLFGLFSIKSVIFPYDINQITYLDKWISFLFFFFLIVLIFSLFSRAFSLITGDKRYIPYYFMKNNLAKESHNQITDQ